MHRPMLRTLTRPRLRARVRFTSAKPVRCLATSAKVFNTVTPSTTTTARPEHAVISTFDLFSIGVGPSSSHTVGPMRAGKIFINDLRELGLLEKVKTIKISL